MNKKLKVIISGGGTGGHIYPAIAVANALKKQRSDIDILFVGAKGKMEMEKVPKAGFPIEGLWISGFHRKLTLRNLSFPFKLISSLWKARKILRRFRPDVVIGVGGFASGPTLEMASRMGIPILVQEQNSYAGMTNKLLAKKADKICTGYQNMERFFPKEKLRWTGNPVRADIRKLDHLKTEGLKHFDLDPDKRTILLFGGSLGAKTLNEAMAANMEILRDNENIQVIWQAGKLYIDTYQSTETAKLPTVQIRAFLDRMDLAYAAADVVICRAGALTISELCMVGKPAILIPSPNVAEDHQTKNAMALVKKEAAILVDDKQAKQRMIPEAIHIMSNDKLKNTLSRNVRQLEKPNAAHDLNGT